MRLKLRELRDVVDATRAEINNDSTALLREEITRAFGPSVDTGVHDLDRIAENVNDRLDVLDRTGRSGVITMKTSVLEKMACNPSAEVRRVAARLLPENFLKIFFGDPDLYVRHAAAERMVASDVKEMLRESPGDDALRAIYKRKKLQEQADEKKERLGDAVKQQSYPELTDQNYATLARKAISDYNQNIEGQWDEAWATRYASAVNATTGVGVDRDKLWKEIQKQLKERDDDIIGKSLKETVQYLRESDDTYAFTEAATKLVKAASSLSSRDYLRQFNELYGVKARGGLPVACSTPHGGELERIDESAADSYVKKWNSLNSAVSLEWHPDTRVAGRILFSAAKRRQ